MKLPILDLEYSEYTYLYQLEVVVSFAVLIMKGSVSFFLDYTALSRQDSVFFFHEWTATDRETDPPFFLGKSEVGNRNEYFRKLWPQKIALLFFCPGFHQRRSTQFMGGKNLGSKGRNSIHIENF